MEVDHVKGFTGFLERERTVAVMMFHRVDKFGGRLALRHRHRGQWANVTWISLAERAHSIGRALLQLGIEKQERIGIFSRNRAEWTIADVAIQSVRAVTVPIHAASSLEEAEAAAIATGIKIIFVGSQEEYDMAAKIIKNAMMLFKIVAFDNDIAISGTSSIHLDDLLDMGRHSHKDDAFRERLDSAVSDDLCTIIYTAGTTGSPRPVAHTQRGMLAAIYSSRVPFPVAREFEAAMVSLPLSQVFERVWHYATLSFGMENYFAPDDFSFAESAAEIRPHYLCSLPHLWEKMHTAVFSPLPLLAEHERHRFDRSLETGTKYFQKKKTGKRIGPLLGLSYSSAHKHVLGGIQNMVGGRSLCFHVGGEPLPAHIQEFFSRAGISLVPAYGLAEFFPVCLGNAVLAQPGLCGPVSPLVEVTVSGRGEILVRGPMVMKGYWNDPEADAAAFTEDDWLRTGDYGSIVEVRGRRYLRIEGRVSDIIETAFGKRLLPQKIESALREDGFILQAAVFGHGRDFLTALIVPDFDPLERHLLDQGMSFPSREELVADEKVMELMELRIAERFASNPADEKPVAFALLPRPFSYEHGELTILGTVRRQVIGGRHAALLEALYR